MYEGEWVAGKRHGFGRLVHKNGVVIAGDWLEGKQHGTAVRHPASPGAGADIVATITPHGGAQP